jgi:hypothetical protein
MPADDLAWLIDHFPQFNAGEDVVFTAGYLRRLRSGAGVRGCVPSELLEQIEKHCASMRGPVAVPDVAD